MSQPGTLSRIDVYVLNQAAATTPVTVQLVDAGNDANLFSGASPDELETEVIGEAVAAGQTSYSWVQLDFSDQEIQLDPDRYYFIWLRMFPPFPADPDLLIRWNMWNDMTVTDPYPGGIAFWCPGSTDTCQAEVQQYRDYAFRVRLTPEPPLCE